MFKFLRKISVLKFIFIELMVHYYCIINYSHMYCEELKNGPWALKNQNLKVINNLA